MKSRRFQKYLQAKAAKKINPLELQAHDIKTDQPAEEIKPEMKAPKKAAAAGTKKDTKKKTTPVKKKGKTKD